MEDASNISTHYYKIGHVSNVKYWIYSYDSDKLQAEDVSNFISTNSSDQALLELELTIRYKYPKILLTYYNKALYYFQFSHNSDNLNLEAEYPLIFKSSSTISTDIISNPAKATNEKSKEKDDKDVKETKEEENTTFLCVSLLKAIKKSLIYELSNDESIKIFGNYIIVKTSNTSHHIIFIDSMILHNGDILLNAIEKTNLVLYDPSILAINERLSNPTNETDLNSNFIIYLIPSGIRCHLFDSLKILNSFTYSPPKNADTIFNLLKLATGIDLSVESNLLWVKLIPNLQHLNNQTSKISKFIHNVDNKKFILWPWTLCVLQFGKFEKNLKPLETVLTPEVKPYNSDPLGLISEFMDFSISNHQHHLSLPMGGANTGTGFSVPSVLSGGIGSIENKNDMGLDEIGDMSIPDLLGGLHNDFFSDDLMNDYHQEGLAGEEPKEEQEEEDEEDLFGGGDSEDDSEPDNEGDANEDVNEQQQETLDVDASMSHVMDQATDNPDLNDLFKQDNFFTKEDDKKLEDELMYFDIPKDQMALKESTPYDDPGAPLPMAATPFVNQKTFSGDVSGSGSSNFGSGNSGNGMMGFNYGINTPNNKRIDSEVSSTKSSFSPIVFNPLIKSNVDNKYGKGGKFYIGKDKEIDSLELPKLRATSVTGYEVRTKAGLGIDYQDKKVFSSSDNDEDEDRIKSEEESDEDEEGINLMGDQGDFSFNYNIGTVGPGTIGPGTVGPGTVGLGTAGPGIMGQGQVVPGVTNGPATVNPSNYPIDKSSTPFPQQPNQRQNSIINQVFNIGTGNSQGFSSPITNFIPSSRFNALAKFETPFDSPGDDKLRYSSPNVSMAHGNMMNMNVNIQTPMPMAMSLSTPMPMSMNAPTVSTSTSNDQQVPTSSTTVSESSNCLPLILRGVNVNTIPSHFLLNNIPGALKILASASDFQMDVDEEDEDFEITKKNEMVIKSDNLNEFLKWLGPNLIFDLGMNRFNDKLISNLPDSQGHILENEPEDREVDGESVGNEFENIILKAFPLSYKVKLDEFISDLLDHKEVRDYDNDVDNQFSFLDDITNDEILNPKTKLKKLDYIEWDSFEVNERNKSSFDKYMGVINDINDNKILDVSESIRNLTGNKIKVVKKLEIINLNSVSTKFWNLMNFQPILGPKSFQILLVSEVNNHNEDYNQSFLDSLIYNYQECNFGDISKVHIDDIEGGLIQIVAGSNHDKDNYYMQIYKQINKKLIWLIESIKLDLINKTNRFEFDRPILLMFVNFNDKFNSLVEITKILRNFTSLLKTHQLPLQVFSKIIPSDLIVKQYNDSRHMKIVSNAKLTRISMNLYNQCPNNPSNNKVNEVETNNLFTNIVKEPISKVNFKLFNQNNTTSTTEDSNDDAFLHLAYERSIDKKWFCASWSDPLGIVTLTKSWSCSNVGKPPNTNQHRNIYDLKSISDEIFDISNTLFKKLNEEIIKRTNGLGGKKFLILTRINSVIPDEELIHWKRLSMKFKDVSLIVLSVNSSVKVLFKEDRGARDEAHDEQQQHHQHQESNRDQPPSEQAQDQDSNGQDTNGIKDEFSPNPPFSTSNFVSSTSNFVSPSSNFVSPIANFNFINTSASFLSPDQGTSTNNSNGSGNQGSGNDTKNQQMNNLIIQDSSDAIIGIIPKAPVPSFNCPTRVGMKLGLLMKKIGSSYIVFEVNLLSCSNYWNLTSLMKLILNHYKKLITLNDILGINSIDDDYGNEQERQRHMITTLIPWHVQAVSKSLEYLVHIEVEE